MRKAAVCVIALGFMSACAGPGAPPARTGDTAAPATAVASAAGSKPSAGAAAAGLPAAAKERLQYWRVRFEKHLREGILAFWLRYAPDNQRGGFHGALDRSGRPDINADRSLVVNARILWTFSAASRMFGGTDYRAAADRAFEYLEAKFRDRQRGGYYWAVDADGKPKDDHKYLYGQSFALYGLSEYFLLTGNARVRQMAFHLYHVFDPRAYDRANGGYMEAFVRDWKPELKVHPIGPADQKSSNTHLHLLESLTSVVRATNHPKVRERLAEIRNLFITKFVDPSGYTREYFRPEWIPAANESSYGHDVELAWLLPEATAALRLPSNDPDTLRISKALVDHSLRDGFDNVKGGFYERGPANGMATDRGKSWWAQAEGLVGLLEVYETTGDPRYLDAFEKTAEFVFRELVDERYGEWYPGFKADGTLLGTEKATFWKGPYHNSRACMEVIKRLDTLIAHAR